jgi:membrane-associated phospholipid phosphatase
MSLAVLAGLPVLARLSRNTTSRLLTVLRLFCAPLLYWAFYHQVQTIWPVLRPAPLDGALAALEARIWGLQPALAFQAALPQRWLAELFCFAYFAYYLFVPVVGLTALLTRGYRTAERILLATTGCFFGCYALFWLFPTVGPHYWFPPGRGPELYPGYLFNHLLFFFTSGGEIRGGAFPSSHLAVALLLTLLARRATPALFPALALITALMVPGVVYLRAHYLLDVPAGLCVGWLAYALSPSGKH